MSDMEMIEAELVEAAALYKHAIAEIGMYRRGLAMPNVFHFRAECEKYLFEVAMKIPDAVVDKVVSEQVRQQART